MLSSGLRKVMKALLILFAAAWITTDANATSEGERAPGLADKRFVSTYPYTAARPTTDDASALVLGPPAVAIAPLLADAQADITSPHASPTRASSTTPTIRSPSCMNEAKKLSVAVCFDGAI